MTQSDPPPVTIRPFLPGDLSALLALNNAAVPAVNALTAEDLLDLVGTSLACLVAAADDTPVGFLLSLADGADYDSPNYRWLSARLSGFAYTDRICIDPGHRGQKIGDRLYQSLFDQAAGSNRAFVCEVNERPPNPGSLRFHKRLGFEEIGTADHGDKAVVFLKRPPEPAGGASTA